MRSYAILLVEDNPDDVKQTLRAFARNNIANEVVVARDGAEALDYLFATGKHAGRDSSIQPGLILLDLKLPRVSGLQVLERIRVDPRSRGVPVVILTSSSEQQDVAASYAAGANNYLRKPVHFASFLSAVRAVGLFWTLVESGLALLHPEIDDSSPDAAEPAAAPPVPPSVPPRPTEILIGMPEGDARARMVQALESEGHTVHQTNTAHGVYGRLFSRFPDVLVLAHDLPDISGVDVARTLRESPQGRAVTSVIVTSDVARCRVEIPDEEIHILERALDPRPIVALMRRMRLSALLRDLAADRARMQPAAGAGHTSNGDPRRPAEGGASAPEAWALLDLPVTAPPEAVSHALHALTNALEERAANATSAHVRTQTSILAARLRQSANELVELHASVRA